MDLDLSDFTAVQVVINGKAFTYKHHNSTPPLEPRQLVVVDFGMKGLTVGVVESFGVVPLDPNAKFKYKWTVNSLSRSFYDHLLAAEAALAEAE